MTCELDVLPRKTSNLMSKAYKAISGNIIQICPMAWWGMILNMILVCVCEREIVSTKQKKNVLKCMLAFFPGTYEAETFEKKIRMFWEDSGSEDSAIY